MSRFGKVVKQWAEDREAVTCYPTYGYRVGTDWHVPLRVWIHEPRFFVENTITATTTRVAGLSTEEAANFKYRIADLVADSESREEVHFQFEGDAASQTWRIQDKSGRFPKSDLNGIVTGFVRLSDQKARRVMERQGSTDGHITYRVVSGGHDGVGRIQLIEPEGLSVISDIDDTIKITELPAGMGVVVRNTFFRDFAAVPGMAKRYQELEADAFHYVSGSPWQLYKPLSTFLEDVGFPPGSFHMKFTPKNVFTLDTWRSLSRLIGDATFNQKVKQISRILRAFPQRRFILVGDSGERDPEVYRKIRDDFGTQIEDIWIRDVVHRLEGMKIIDAPRIESGVSEL